MDNTSSVSPKIDLKPSFDESGGSTTSTSSKVWTVIKSKIGIFQENYNINMHDGHQLHCGTQVKYGIRCSHCRKQDTKQENKNKMSHAERNIKESCTGMYVSIL